MSKLKAPFPYFGGKSSVAEVVWSRFGQVKGYVEPFCGSMAMLLACPYEVSHEIVNDFDGLLVNFWRAVKYAPEEVAFYSDVPSTSLDYVSRNNYVFEHKPDLHQKLYNDADYYDPKMAGYWVYVRSCAPAGRGMFEEKMGIRVPRYAGAGIHSPSRARSNKEVLEELADRLREVVILNGDFEKALSIPSRSWVSKPQAVFLDPPYQEGEYNDDVYEHKDEDVFQRAVDWCLEHGDNPDLRIALCGYDSIEMPDTWETYAWTTHGGFGNLSKAEDTRGKVNAGRERIWFSPHCLKPNETSTIFDSFKG